MKVLITDNGVYLNDVLMPVVAFHVSANAEAGGTVKLSLRLLVPASDVTVDLTNVSEPVKYTK